MSVALGHAAGGISRGRRRPLRLPGRRARRGPCLRGDSRVQGAGLRGLLLRLGAWAREVSRG